MKEHRTHWTDNIIDFFDNVTKVLTIIAITVGPWAAPAGPAYAVSRSLVRNLGFPISVACAAALAVELAGIGALNVTLAAFRERRKTQLRFYLGMISIIAYLSIGITLTVGLGENQAIALFFMLAGASYLTQALHIQHIAQIQYEKENAEQDRLEKQRTKALRRVESAIKRGMPASEKDWRDAGFDKPPDLRNVKQAVKSTDKKLSSVVRQNARQSILTAIGDEYRGTITQLAKRASVSRPTLYSHLETLEKEGVISRNTGHVKKLTQD